MSIRVQCGGCGSVMNVRDEYAGTERRCPKCKGKFQVPAAGSSSGSSSGLSSKSIAGDDFDPVAYLTGETPLPGTLPAVPGAAPKTRPADFDPLDVLTGGGGGQPGATGKSTPAAPAVPAARAKSPPAANSPAVAPSSAPPQFDPLDVLSSPPPAPAATPTPAAPAAATALPPPLAAAPGGQPAKPQPRKPAWAKSAPEPERNDWDDPPPAPPPVEAPPPAQPDKPQPRKPSWAKAAPPAEKNDWDDPPPAGAAPTPEVATPQPKRPSWAKPLPGEQPLTAAEAATAVAADASPAALAAAAAMGATIAGVSSENPALQAEQPKEPWFNPAAAVAAFRRRIPLMLKTLVASATLFITAWWFVQPRRVVWKVVGSNQKLELVPVAGRITVDGKPVPYARVMFHPRGVPYRSPEGRTDGEGQYTLSFCEGHSGAPAGRYRVQLQLIGKDGSDGGSQADQLLRDKSFEVPSGGGTVDVTLDTKSKPAG